MGAVKTDRLINHIQVAENTAGALSCPHPSTLYYTRNTAFGTAYHNAFDIITFIRPDHLDQSDQVYHAMGNDIRGDLMHSLERAGLPHPRLVWRDNSRTTC